MTRWPRLAEGWLSLFILIVMIEGAVSSVVAASWVDGLGILSWVALIAIVWGLVLAKVRAPGIFLHSLAAGVGCGVVVYMVCSSLPEGSFEDRFAEVTTRLFNWIDIATSGGIANDNLLFLLLLASIVWFIGYVGSWTVFHSHNAWWVSAAAGTGIVVNLSYAPHLSSHFFLFLICAVLLVVRLNVYKQETVWRKGGVDYGADLGWGLVRTSFLISTVVVAMAWLTPSTILANSVVSEAFAPVTRPWDDMQSEFSRLFGGVRPKGVSASSGFGKTLPLKSGVRLGNDVVLQVSGTEARRLRGVVYERYTGQGWLAAERAGYKIAAEGEPPILAPEYALRKDITQTITVVEPRGNIVFTPSLPKQLSLPTMAEMELPPTVSLDVSSIDESQDASPELIEVAQELKEIVARERLSFGSGASDAEVPQATVAAISNRLASNFELVGMKMRSEQVVSADLRPIDMDYADISVLRNPSMARKGFRYAVVSSVSVADVESLRAAGDDYPDWLSRRYLPLPQTVTARTVRLARRLAAQHSNPYDAVTAIEFYLRTELGYNDVVNVPPSTRDGVDYFLFEGKEGYCDYFASAFVVMARALGIPARVVSGYAPGEIDFAQNVTWVKDWHAHSWPEVYFPKYGWIEFEPTPSRPSVFRPEISESLALLATPRATYGEDFFFGEEFLNGEFMGGIPSGGLPTGYESNGIAGFLIKTLSAIAVIALAGYATARYFWGRGLGNLGPAETIYIKMCRLISWLRIRRRPDQTPNEFAAFLATVVPPQQGNVRQITDAYVRQVYGKKALSPDGQRELSDAWRQVRDALLRSVLKRR